MEYEVNVNDNAFNHIIKKKKTIEVRVEKGIFINLKTNDIIKFKNSKNEKLNKVVKKIYIYRTFKELLKKEKLNRILPSINNIYKGYSYYNNLYSFCNVKKYNVIAIQLK